MPVIRELFELSYKVDSDYEEKYDVYEMNGTEYRYSFEVR